MTTPTHLAHKPITAMENYEKFDGRYANKTDVKSLSVGFAQYDYSDISAKVFRYTGGKWSRQSEELPIHRVFDLSTIILKSIMLSGGIKMPLSSLEITEIDPAELDKIIEFYKQNRSMLLPKLQELQTILNYFIQEEPKF